MRIVVAFFSFTLLIVGISSCKREELGPAVNSKGEIKLDSPTLQDIVNGRYFGNILAHCDGDACHEESDYNGKEVVNITGSGDSINFYLFGQHTLKYAGYDIATSRFHYSYRVGYAYADTFYYRDKCDAYFKSNGDSFYITSSSNHDGMCSAWASGSKIN